MDYKELLKKYIHHILDQEHCHYVNDININDFISTVKFSNEEVDELTSIAKEVDDKWLGL